MLKVEIYTIILVVLFMLSLCLQMHKRRFYLNTTTMEVLKENPTVTTGSYSLQPRGTQYIQAENYEKWSVKDYNGVSYPSDKLFLNRLRNLVQRFQDILEGLLS
jgi:hypothetical protein